MFTTQEKEFIDSYPHLKNTPLAEKMSDHFGWKKNHRKIDNLRRKIRRYRKAPTRLENSKEFKKAMSKSLAKDTQCYIFTWEQNETPLHKEFWENLIAYKEFRGAELSVILGRYKNPTTPQMDDTHDVWNPLTEPYWDANRHDLLENLRVLSDVKVSPTAKYPLSSLQHLGGGKTIIVGHPKMHMVSEPVLNGYHLKTSWTTGACTLENYSDSKVGKSSEGNHKIGFIIVEVSGDNNFHIRQVEADPSGTFVDLKYKVQAGRVQQASNYLGMVCGDTHFGHTDEKIDAVNDAICKRFKVPALVLHDAVDGESCNHHILKNPIARFKRVSEGKHLIEKELNDFLHWLSKKLRWNPIIPQANHNARFDRILANDWRGDIENALFYLKYSKLACEGKLDKGVLAYVVEENLPTVKCLKYTESFKIGKYEVGQHGDSGSNGAKGSFRGFHNLGIPIILAHTHSPYRADDCLYVGTNTRLQLGYNEKGASSWRHANVLINELGIAQHILFDSDGNFTTQ